MSQTPTTCDYKDCKRPMEEFPEQDIPYCTYHQRLHAAAPELLKAAEGYLEIAQAILDGDEVEDETWEAIVADLKPIIASAMVGEIEGQ